MSLCCCFAVNSGRYASLCASCMWLTALSCGMARQALLIYEVPYVPGESRPRGSSLYDLGGCEVVAHEQPKKFGLLEMGNPSKQ